jgi:ATP-dependent DNA ligase
MVTHRSIKAADARPTALQLRRERGGRQAVPAPSLVQRRAQGATEHFRRIRLTEQREALVASLRHRSLLREVAGERILLCHLEPRLWCGVFLVAFQRRKPTDMGVKSPLPAFIEPALATAIEKVPSGDRWIHEIKFDG